MNTAIRIMALTVTVLLASATAAYAAVPANDNRADATVIDTLPFSDTVDIAEATTEEGEAAVLHCGGNQKSVWYRHTAAADGMMVASTAGSDFGAPTLAVYEGSFESMSAVACDQGYGKPAVVAVEAIKGLTYYFQASKPYDHPADAGTQLDFSLHWQPAVQTDIDSTVWTLANGRATITGVVRCSDPVALRLEVTLVQWVDGERTNYARNTAFAACDGTTAWQSNSWGWDKPFTSVGYINATVDASSHAERIYQRTRVRPEPVRCTRIGTLGSDTIEGTSGDDRLCTLYGDDFINSRAGDDTVYAEDGSDTVNTGRGQDTVHPGQGRDTIELGIGNDVAKGGEGRDRIFGEDGADTLFGNGDSDVLAGGSGSDTCVGGPGTDSFRSCEAKR